MKTGAARRGRCHYCDRRGRVTQDHIVPRSLFRALPDPAPDWFLADNTVPACDPCNRRKGSSRGPCNCSKCERQWALYRVLSEQRDPLELLQWGI